jgi:hypothetical protein
MPSVTPKLTAPLPNVSLPAAGLALLKTTAHSTIFAPDDACAPPRSQTCLGTYNNAPFITTIASTLVVSWHNSAVDEDAPGGRVLYSMSAINDSAWSTPAVLFDRLSPIVPQNASTNATLRSTVVYGEPFVRLSSGNTYAVGAAYNRRCTAGCRASDPMCAHCLDTCACAVKTRLPFLMRRLEMVDAATRQSALGPVFWLADAQELSRLNLSSTEAAVPSVERMADGVRADANEFLRGYLRGGNVPAGPPGVLLTERSAYVQASGAVAVRREGPVPLSLVMLLRDDGPAPTLRLWASLCELSVNGSAAADRIARASVDGQGTMIVPKQCNWTAPVPTNIPDSRSATFAGVTDAGTVLLGAQLPRVWDRDPLTLAMSADGGRTFDRLVAMRAGAPPVRFPGVGKGTNRGFMYPSAVVAVAAGEQRLVVAYSVNKEAIAATSVPLASLGPAYSMTTGRRSVSNP